MMTLWKSLDLVNAPHIGYIESRKFHGKGGKLGEIEGQKDANPEWIHRIYARMVNNQNAEG